MTPGKGFFAGTRCFSKKLQALCAKRSTLCNHCPAHETSVGLLAGCSFAENTLFCKKLQEKAVCKRMTTGSFAPFQKQFHALALGPRVAQLGYLAVHGLRQPAHVVQVPLPLLRLPALAQPVVEGPRLLQFSGALQQQRLQVVTGVRPAEPPEHPRLVAGLYGHHAFTLVRLRLWSAGHKRTASPACAGRAAALL